MEDEESVKVVGLVIQEDGSAVDGAKLFRMISMSWTCVSLRVRNLALVVSS